MNQALLHIRVSRGKILKKESDLLLYKDERFYASFPAISPLRNGNFLLVFRRARDARQLIGSDPGPLSEQEREDLEKLRHMVDHIDARSQLVSIEYDPMMRPVSEPLQLSADPQAADQDASLLLLNNGNLLLSSFSWYPLPSRLAAILDKQGVQIAGGSNPANDHYIMWGGFTRLSADNGRTWSEHKYLPHLPLAKDIIPGIRDSCGAPTRGQAVEIGNEILLAVYKTVEPVATSSCHLYVSRDNGHHWHFRSTIAMDFKQKIAFYEPALIACENGNIMAFLRTGNAADKLYTSVSSDQGKSWQTPLCRQEITGHPPHPLKLQDGRIFLAYGYRHKPYGVRARLMDANGEAFISDELIIRDDASCADAGYPWSAQLDDQHVVVVYYFTGKDGIRHIAASIINLSGTEAGG